MISIAPRQTALDTFEPNTQAVMDVYARTGSRGPSVFDGMGQSRLGHDLFRDRDEWAAYKHWNAIAINCYSTICSSVRPQVCRVINSSSGSKKKRQSHWTLEQRIHFEQHYAQSVGEAMIENIEPIPDHPLALLLDKVNAQHNWEMHAQLTWQSLRVSGEAYWYMPGNGVGVDGSSLPGAIAYIPESWLHPNTAGGSLTGWTIRDPNAMEPIEADPDEVLRIYYPDPEHPGRALSPSRQIEGFITGSEAVTMMRTTRFSRGGDTAVMLIPEAGATIEDDEIRKLLSQLKSRSTLANTGLPMVLPPNLKPHNIGQTNSDMQLTDSDEQLMRSVFAGHGVSPIIAGVTVDLNRATAHAAMQSTCELTFNPALRFLAGVLTEQVAMRYGDGAFVWFPPITTKTVEEEIQRINTRAANGAITPSEVSVAMGGKPDDRPEANVPYINAGMTPLYYAEGMQKPEPPSGSDPAKGLMDDGSDDEDDDDAEDVEDK